MQVLDHAAVDRDHALALGLRRLEGCDDLGRHLELGGRRCEDLVARLDLAGMNQRLAVEAHLQPLPADIFEALGVLDVVVDAVEDGEPVGTRRQHAQTERRHHRQAHRRVTRTHVLTRSLVPMMKSCRRSWAPAISSARRMALGVSIMAHTAIEVGAPPDTSSETISTTSPALSTFGTTIASAPEVAIAVTSALPQGVARPLQRMAISRLP